MEVVRSVSVQISSSQELSMLKVPFYICVCMYIVFRCCVSTDLKYCDLVRRSSEKILGGTYRSESNLSGLSRQG